MFWRVVHDDPCAADSERRQLALAAADSGDLVIATMENGRATVRPLAQTPATEQ